MEHNFFKSCIAILEKSIDYEDIAETIKDINQCFYLQNHCFDENEIRNFIKNARIKNIYLTAIAQAAKAIISDNVKTIQEATLYELKNELTFEQLKLCIKGVLTSIKRFQSLDGIQDEVIKCMLNEDISVLNKYKTNSFFKL